MLPKLPSLSYGQDFFLSRVILFISLLNSFNPATPAIRLLSDLPGRQTLAGQQAQTHFEYARPKLRLTLRETMTLEVLTRHLLRLCTNQWMR